MSILPPSHGGRRSHKPKASPDAAFQVQKCRPARKLPLAALLVERGDFADLEEARRWIMAGKVLLNEQRLDKPGMAVPQDASIRILGRSRYASRAGYKLEAALAHFAVKAWQS